MRKKTETQDGQLHFFGNHRKRDVDPAIWLEWGFSAALVGCPSWQAHLCVRGDRGSGKSRLIELTDTLLGGLAGGVVNRGMPTIRYLKHGLDVWMASKACGSDQLLQGRVQ